jgi:hypothetical protein
VNAFYVVFHVKRRCLWITSVDNYGGGAAPTERDGRRRPKHCLNG